MKRCSSCVYWVEAPPYVERADGTNVVLLRRGTCANRGSPCHDLTTAAVFGCVLHKETPDGKA